jgi:hypothetical protein
MKFECGDLERALAVPELMVEAREHLKLCALCRREYRVWTEISSAAKELHQEWETPDLWPAIGRQIEAGRELPDPWWKRSWVWACAMALLCAVLLPLALWQRAAPRKPPAPAPTQMAAGAEDRDFLTDQALHEVETSEAAYRKSIDRLSQLASPRLQKTTSPAVACAREKLLLLDSAIAETRANVGSNRFNIRLQTTLADLYRQKQHTLQDLLTHNEKN